MTVLEPEGTSGISGLTTPNYTSGLTTPATEFASFSAYGADEQIEDVGTQPLQRVG